jgi:hypothetical protein
MLRKKRIGWMGWLAASLVLATAPTAGRAQDQNDPRSGYTYVREVEGLVTVESRYNGRVDARRNQPISVGDEVFVADGGRLEVGLADGNLLHVGGGTRVRFNELAQGEEGDESAIELLDGSVVLVAYGYEEGRIPRVDTEDATVYLRTGSRARVNFDPRRGTAVVVREGTADVRTRTASETVKAGRYLMVRGEEDPVVEAGSFSRDRFDVWSAERLELVYAQGTSSRHVGEDYASDVQSMDGYGDWSYNTTYSSYVWTPRVSVGWSPYTYGSWYYTPAGLTWWSNDPWGWYPYHYGNWFWDVGWSRWCWTPGWAYSPAWVYWAYSPGYVGWCPIGWYSYYRPWWNSYYHHWGVPRGGVYLSVHGSYATRNVDLRGWSFTNDRNVGVVNARMEVTPGERLSRQLGDRVAISSRPVVVNARGGADTREALQEYVRQAPRTIERTAAKDADRLGPVLARQERLPDVTVDSLRRSTVVSERGRLAGATAAEIAPRGTTVDRRSALDGSRVVAPRGEASERVRAATEGTGSTGRPTSRTVERAPVDRGAPATGDDAPPTAEGRGQAREPSQAPEARRPAERPDSWRGRTTRQAAPAESSTERSAPAPSSDTERATPADTQERPAPRASSPRSRGEAASDWRTRQNAPTSEPAREVEQTERPAVRFSDRQGDWRSRQAPAAQRVIEGAVPPADRRVAPRGQETRQRSAPPPRSDGGSARSAPASPPPPRDYSPAPRSAPAPSSSQRSSPPPQASSSGQSSRSAPSSRPSSSSGARPSGGQGSSPRSSGRRN